MNRYNFSFLFNKLTWNDQEVKKPAKEEKLNESTASSEQSSSGPEFEIINSDDVPAVEEIQVNTGLLIETVVYIASFVYIYKLVNFRSNYFVLIENGKRKARRNH